MRAVKGDGDDNVDASKGMMRRFCGITMSFKVVAQVPSLSSR